MKKVFLSGPVTGLDYDQVVKSFNAAEQLMLDKGYQVLKPTAFVPADSNWINAMRRCLVALSKCDAIYMLKGFYNSRGSVLELQIAHELELECMFEEKEFEKVLNG